MPVFRYEAVDRKGKTVRGAMTADNVACVKSNLEKMGYTMQTAYDPYASQATTTQKQAAPATQPAPAQTQDDAPRTIGRSVKSVTLPDGLPVNVRPKISPGKLAAFFRQLATLLKSGMSPYDALTRVMPRSPMAVKRAVSQMLPQVRQGTSLSMAMSSHVDVFPVHTIAVIWGGELSGHLFESVDELATVYEKETKDWLYGRAGWFFAKLTMLILVGLVLPLIYIILVSIPKLFGMDGGMGVDVSSSEELITNSLQAGTGSYSVKWMIDQMVSAVVRYGLPASVGLVVFWYVWGYIKNVPNVRLFLDRLLLYVPLWGTIAKKRAIAAFLSSFVKMIDSGASIKSAWEAASLAPKNSAFAYALKFYGAPPPENVGAVDRMAASKYFDRQDMDMVYTGETTGQLPYSVQGVISRSLARADALATVGKVVSFILLSSISAIVAGALFVYFYSEFYAVQARFLETFGVSI